MTDRTALYCVMAVYECCVSISQTRLVLCTVLWLCTNAVCFFVTDRTSALYYVMAVYECCVSM